MVKYIFTTLVVAVFVEVVWAGWTLLKPSPAVVLNTPTQTVQPVVQVKPTVFSLVTPNTNLKVGEKFNVLINISSEKLTDGVDLIILYNPKLLSVLPTATDKSPITLGTLYNDYPQNKVDATVGRITVSGITNGKNGVIPNGLFGSISFQAKAAGNAKISFDFAPGSTTHSNVTQTGTSKNILDKVNDLEVIIK